MNRLPSTNRSQVRSMASMHQQRGMSMIEAMISLALIAVTAMGVMNITTKTATAKRELAIREIVVQELQQRLRTTAIDTLCSGAALPNLALEFPVDAVNQDYDPDDEDAERIVTSTYTVNLQPEVVSGCNQVVQVNGVDTVAHGRISLRVTDNLLGGEVIVGGS